MSYESGVPNAPNEIFKTLADPNRRAVFEQLIREGEQNVRSLTKHAGISQPAVSKHLSILKQAGLVRERPQGRAVHYSANPKGLTPLMDWINLYGVFWKNSFDKLEHLLDGMQE